MYNLMNDASFMRENSEYSRIYSLYNLITVAFSFTNTYYRKLSKNLSQRHDGNNPDASVDGFWTKYSLVCGNTSLLSSGFFPPFSTAL